MAKRGGRSIDDWHRAFLGVLGLAYSLAGAEAFYAVARGNGLFADPVASALPLVLLALPSLGPLALLLPHLLPRFLASPSRWFHVPAAVVAILILTAAGDFPVFLYGASTGLASDALRGSGSVFLPFARPVLFVAVVFTSILCVRSSRAGSQARADAIPPVSRNDRMSLENAHLLFLRITGLAMFAVVAYGVAVEPNPPVWKAVSAFLGFLAAVLFLSPDRTPRLLARPSRWYHFFGWNLLTTVLMTFALLPYAFGTYGPIFALTAADAGARVSRSPDDLASFLGRMLIDDPAIVAFGTIGLPLTLAWLTMIGLLFQLPAGTQIHERSARAATVPAVARKGPRPGRLPERPLPTIGPAMKLYAAADWVILRALGVGLMATAYMIWTMIETDRVLNLPQLTRGFDPMGAIIVHAAFGALIAIPFALPRAIARPRHVVGGLAKSVLLVGMSLALLPALDVAIALHVPELYRATLQATAPNVFKAIAGVAVTSALLISFFRQMETPPPADLSGEPLVTLPEAELRAIRQARMGA